jgi:hypothetical protein
MIKRSRSYSIERMANENTETKDTIIKISVSLQQNYDIITIKPRAIKLSQ